MATQAGLARRDIDDGAEVGACVHARDEHIHMPVLVCTSGKRGAQASTHCDALMVSTQTGFGGVWPRASLAKLGHERTPLSTCCVVRRFLPLGQHALG